MDTAFDNVEDLHQVLVELEWAAPASPRWGVIDEAYMEAMAQWADAPMTWGFEEETEGPSQWAEGLAEMAEMDALSEALARWE